VYYQAACTGIDPEANVIMCVGMFYSLCNEVPNAYELGTGENATPFNLKYDQLIISVGATNATFNTPGAIILSLYI
jgi:NADH dehydrogenase FAD-containing subunit